MQQLLFKRNLSTISHVYRLHHAPTVPITLKSLIVRGPEPPINSTNWAEWEAENEHKIIESAQHLHREIPIRLAGRIVDLENLPHGLSDVPSVVHLRDMLLQSFEEMINYPCPVDRMTERNFIKMQMDIRQRHTTMHGGIRQALSDVNVEFDPSLAAILDNFYSSRIGIRMLVDQHIAMQQCKAGYIGIIANECCPIQVAKLVVKDIEKQCESAFGSRSPKFEVIGRADALFKYIPGHLAIILTEAMKNAVQNTVAGPTSNESHLISVQVAGGERGVSVKICDNGGGMHWEDTPLIWSYLKSTAKGTASASYDPVASDLDHRLNELHFNDPFGMPIARLYSRYFGGELSVMPMEGLGTDVYVHLKRLTDDLEVY